MIIGCKGDQSKVQEEEKSVRDGLNVEVDLWFRNILFDRNEWKNWIKGLKYISFCIFRYSKVLMKGDIFIFGW